MIIGEDRIEIGYELLSIKLDYVIVKVDLRKHFQIGVQIERGICYSGLEKKLHESRIILKVSSGLHEIIETKRTGDYPNVYHLLIEFPG